jgi:hypothetical protein
MKTIILYGLLLILSFVAVFSLLHVFNQAAEIDDLKSQIGLQKQALHFMQDVSNVAMPSCAVSVATFESVAKRNGRSVVLWQDQTALVGPFRIKRNASCVTELKLVGLSN